ncbi:alpha/beta hydrolase [Breznakiella homolactica]|uniref:Alpha/beta hydrolase n=1 Tax=Breznakiella homolactica TaxID=2798577 RepID=A0A7T7XLW8_9SPIR|nr:alpha/beta hydrolase [Breznakiella homolactica]QQO08805.1 alpha/beta hydrolase [Breznakiella homolactica]
MNRIFRNGPLLCVTAMMALFSSCVSTIKLKDAQRETVSLEAQEYYQKHKAVRLPALGITETIAAGIAAYDARKHAPEVNLYLEQHKLAVDRETIAGVPVAVITPSGGSRDDVLGLYIHGGGFIAGEPVDYFVLHMARLLGISIVSIDYSLSPRAQFPEALDECFRVYQALVSAPESGRIIVFGVSAGGNLVLTTLLKAREAALPYPAAAVLCTPWADLTGSGDSYVANDGRDILAWNNSVEKTVLAYIGKREDFTNPLISPIYADYPRDFPPCFITTGTRDLLLSDALRLRVLLKESGVPVQLAVYEGMWHGFNTVPDIPEGESCNQEILDFLYSLGL